MASHLFYFDSHFSIKSTSWTENICGKYCFQSSLLKVNRQTDFTSPHMIIYTCTHVKSSFFLINLLYIIKLAGNISLLLSNLNSLIMFLFYDFVQNISKNLSSAIFKIKNAFRYLIGLSRLIYY